MSVQVSGTPLDCSADLLIFSFDSCSTYRCTPVNRAALSSCMDPKRQTSQLVNRVISSVNFVSQTFCERASTSIKNKESRLPLQTPGPFMVVDFRARRNLFLPPVFSKGRTDRGWPSQKETSGEDHEPDRHWTAAFRSARRMQERNLG